jgi:hypothetical protein
MDAGWAECYATEPRAWAQIDGHLYTWARTLTKLEFQAVTTLMAQHIPATAWPDRVRVGLTVDGVCQCGHCFDQP